MWLKVSGPLNCLNKGRGLSLSLSAVLSQGFGRSALLQENETSFVLGRVVIEAISPAAFSCRCISGKPGPLSWTQRATSLGREPNRHQRYITQQPQSPSGSKRIVQ